MPNNQPYRKPMRSDTARHKLWRSMRYLTRTQGGFTLAELEAAAEAAYGSAYQYVRALVRAGYLSRTGFVSRNSRSHQARWTLLRDTGPLAPRVRVDRKTVTDLNLQSASEAAPAAERASESASCARERQRANQKSGGNL